MIAEAAVATEPRRGLPAAASALLAVAAAAWLATVALARGMGATAGTMGLAPRAFVGVWTLMMAAMMLPSVTPFTMLYARRTPDARSARLGLLVAGYLLAWAATGIPVYGLARAAGAIADGHAHLATGAAVAIFGVWGSTSSRRSRTAAWSAAAHPSASCCTTAATRGLPGS